MKKLIVIAALAFALGTVQTAVACDFGAHAANATPVVLATTEQETTTQQPAAKSEHAAPVKIATDKPLAPAATVADCSGGTAKLAFRLLCAISQWCRPSA
jgi:hypothetical protein